MKIYIVIWEDRHADVGADPFSSEEKAIQWTTTQLKKVGVDNPINQVESYQRKYGCVFFHCYSSEGDCIRIVEKTLDASF